LSDNVPGRTPALQLDDDAPALVVDGEQIDDATKTCLYLTIDDQKTLSKNVRMRLDPILEPTLAVNLTRTYPL
jgi:hypothetical protein